MGPHLREGRKQAPALEGVRSQPAVPLGVGGGWDAWNRLASQELCSQCPALLRMDVAES